MEGGSVFDTSYETVARENNIFVEGRKYTTLRFVVGTGEVRPGFEIGFRRLRPGSKAILVIPSPLGYQNLSNSDRIPPNSILVFDVDFLGID
jgi:FKBP-type peptidyl-prolyl cis-trans isomerase FkpA